MPQSRIKWGRGLCLFCSAIQLDVIILHSTVVSVNVFEAIVKYLS